jgi:hypothetical protein
MTISTHDSFRESGTHMPAVRTAIGHQLRADYLPILAEPLPAKLKSLIARFATTERSSEVSQSAIAQSYAAAVNRAKD